jgi:hypothetical protein
LRSVKISTEENKGTKQMNFLFSYPVPFHRLSFRFFSFLVCLLFPMVVFLIFVFYFGFFCFVSLSNPFTFLNFFVFHLYSCIFRLVFFLCFSSAIFFS